MTKQAKKKVEAAKEEPTIQVVQGNTDVIMIQFLQAINNQLRQVIHILKEIKESK